MKKEFESILVTGLGIILTTTEGAENLVKKLVQNGKAKEPEVRKKVEKAVAIFNKKKIEALEEINYILKKAEKATRPPRKNSRKTSTKK